MELAFDFDFIVMGWGFGGSVSAHRLTEKGDRVGVMEWGAVGVPRTFRKATGICVDGCGCWHRYRIDPVAEMSLTQPAPLEPLPMRDLCRFRGGSVLLQLAGQYGAGVNIHGSTCPPCPKVMGVLRAVRGRAGSEAGTAASVPSTSSGRGVLDRAHGISMA